MKVTTDFVAGNYSDKYGTQNPVYRKLMENFLSTFSELLNQVKNELPTQPVLAEVGVGEGHLSQNILGIYPESQLYISDLSPSVLKQAEMNLSKFAVHSSIEDAENLSYADSFFDLVVCCEVLEHVEKPQIAIKELYRTSKKYVVVSVPNEPIWRILNMLRGKYLSEWGNTPGHLNHWSSNQFETFVTNAGFTVKAKRNPFPWTMFLLQK